MIVELVVAVCLVWGGGLTMRVAGLRSAELAITSVLAGVMVYLTVMTLQVVTPLPTSPVLTLIALVGLPTVWWLVARARGRDVGIAIVPAAFTVASVVAGVAAFRALGMLNWHGDSAFYALQGTTLTTGHFYDAMFVEYYLKRPLGVPALHAPAALQGEQVLLGVTPLITCAALAWLGWCLHRGASGALSRRSAMALAVLAVAFVATSNRVIFHAFYINGHLLLGTMVAVAAGAAWLWAQRRIPARAAVVLVAGATVAAIVTRPEGAITMGLVLVPVLTSEAFTVAARRFLARWFGLAVLVWSAWGWWVVAHTGEQVPRSLLAQAVAAVAVLAAAPLIGRSWWQRHAHTMMVIVELVLWLAVLAFTVVDPQVTVDSVQATATNQFKAGKWGITVVATAIAVLVVTAWVRIPAGAILRFPVTTFLPLVLVLAHVREGAYRVGAYDSLNRMWMQVLLVAIIYIGVAVACGSPRRSRSTDPSGSRSYEDSATRAA